MGAQVNYRKSGEAYWNLLHIRPVFHPVAHPARSAKTSSGGAGAEEKAEGKLAYFVSVQFDLGKPSVARSSNGALR